MRKSGLLNRFTSSDDIIRVTGDINHTFKTAQFVTSQYKCDFLIEEEKDGVWHDRAHNVVPNAREVYAHEIEYQNDANDTVDFEIDKLILNKSLRSLRINPQATQSWIDVDSRLQGEILPYLTDYGQYNDVLRHETRGREHSFRKGDMLEISATGSPPPPGIMVNGAAADYRLFLSEQDVFFINHESDEADPFTNCIASLDAATGTRFVLAAGLGNERRPTYRDPVRPQDDGLFGLPLKYELDAVTNEFTYKCTLNDWLFRVDLTSVGQATTNARTARFDFQFSANSAIRIRFDSRGHGVTENVSVNREEDVNGFHVFQIYDHTIDATVLGGGEDPGQLANCAKFGNLLFPSTSASRLLAVVDLTNNVFPIFNVAGNRQNLYLYVPKRRFSRRTEIPGKQVVETPRLIPTLAANTAVGNFQLSAEVLGWFARDAIRGRASVFPSAEIEPLFRFDKVGTISPYFLRVGGHANLRDWSYQLEGYFSTGWLNEYLTSLDPLGDGAALPEHQVYSFVAAFPYEIEKVAGPVWAANIVLASVPRNEIFWFKKADIARVTVNGVHYRYLSHTAWHRPFDVNPLRPGIVAIQNDIDGVNAGAGDDLVYAAFMRDAESTTPRAFTTQPYLSLADLQVTTLPAARTMNRPSGANPNPVRLTQNFSVGDNYYTNDPPNENYYVTYAGDGTIVQVGGFDAYHLPPAHAFQRTPADILAYAGDNGRVNIDDSRIKSFISALTAKVYLLGDISSYFENQPTPVVRNLPTTVISHTEPLLGFFGISQFNCSSIYPNLKDFPPFMQDWEYNFKRNGYVNYQSVQNPTRINRLVPTGDMVLSIESSDTFDQKDKELFDINLPWPKVEHFSSKTSFAGGVFTAPGTTNLAGLEKYPIVHCKTVRGKPDFLFIQLKHVHDTSSISTLGNNPVIKTLSMNILGQDLKCISELDEELVYQTTRKNSHPLSASEKNYHSIGAVLLNRQDCGDFVQWQLLEGVDEFQVDVTVTDFDYALQAGVNGFHTNLDIELHVYFIYQNYSITGKAHEAVYRKNEWH